MLNLLSTFLILCFLLISGESDDENELEAVFTLTSDNFDEFVSAHPRVLVEFYAPWCGHCKALAPEYEKAAEVLHTDDEIDTHLAKVDATKDKELATKYGVSGFPTLKYFTNGDLENPIDYSGGRTQDTIISWLRSRALPPVSQLSTTEDLELFKKKAKVVLIGFVEKDSEAAKALATVAENNRESILVGQISDSSLAVENVQFGNIYIFRDFSEPVIKMSTSEISAETITDFLNAERFPLIDAIGPENYKEYMERGIPLVWISLNADDDDMLSSTLALLMPFAEEYKGQLSFTYVDAIKYEQHVKNLGISGVPGIMISDEAKKFLYKSDISAAEDLKSFFDSYSAGTLEPHLKSEALPESNDGNVFVLVGKSFADVVGKEKDVFVEYYAPWCGHCKKLSPEYEVVGEAFAGVDDLIIAKIDATENDTPEEIRGFPTLIFYPAGSYPPNGILFEGDRKSQAIIDWIKNAATVDTDGVKVEL